VSTSLREGFRSFFLFLGLLLAVPVIGLPLLWLLDATIGETAATVILGVIVGALIATVLYRELRKDTPGEGRRRSLLKTAG
jgi:hypothetical protein